MEAPAPPTDLRRAPRSNGVTEALQAHVPYDSLTPMARLDSSFKVCTSHGHGSG